MEKTKRFAMLIDAENIPGRYIRYALESVEGEGNVSFRRVYANWASTRRGEWRSISQSYGILPVQQYHHTEGKNAADIAMVIDAMDILHTGDVDGFCLVTSDSDFTRLALRLREGGMKVIGMGERKTPRAFVMACERFVYLDEMYQEARARDAQLAGNGVGFAQDAETDADRDAGEMPTPEPSKPAPQNGRRKVAAAPKPEPAPEPMAEPTPEPAPQPTLTIEEAEPESAPEAELAPSQPAKPRRNNRRRRRKPRPASVGGETVAEEPTEQRASDEAPADAPASEAPQAVAEQRPASEDGAIEQGEAPSEQGEAPFVEDKTPKAARRRHHKDRVKAAPEAQTEAESPQAPEAQTEAEPPQAPEAQTEAESPQAPEATVERHSRKAKAASVPEESEPKRRGRKRKDAKLPASPLTPADLEPLRYAVGQVLDQSARPDGWLFVGALGRSLVRMEPNFDAQKLGFKNLAAMVEALDGFEIRHGDGVTDAKRALFVRRKG